jgi:hypothetical protein
MRQRAPFLVLCLTFASLSCNTTVGEQNQSTSLPQGEISASRFSISGVSIGSTKRRVLRAFGEPARLDNPGLSDFTDLPQQVLHYGGIEILMEGDEVYRLECSSPAFATRDGVRVGDSVARVERIYGRGERYVTYPGEEYLRYNVAHTDTYLLFQIAQDRVEKIILGFDFT